MAECFCPLATIDDCLENGINAAGLDRQLHISCDDEVAAIPAPAANTHKVTSDITMRSAVVGPPAVAAGKFKKWPFSSEEQSWTSDPDPASGVWKTETKVFIPQLTADKTYQFNGIGGENKIVIVKDRNGNRRIVGSKGNGCRVIAKEQMTPKNGYMVTILWESPSSPLYYTGNIVV